MTEYAQKIGASARVAKTIVYDDLAESSQNLLWSILRYNAAIVAKTTNVLRQQPEELDKGTGFPYIIVPYPEIIEKPVTLRMKDTSINFTLEVYSKQSEKVAGLVSDVRQAIRGSISLFGKFRLDRSIIDFGAVEPYSLDDDDTAYRVEIYPRFTAVINMLTSD